MAAARKPTAEQEREHYATIIREREIAGMLLPLDVLARSMESKWGVGRLPTLVSPELAGKFASASAKLDAALSDPARDVAEIRTRIEVMMRGWRALDDAAVADPNASPMPDGVWCIEFEGQEYAVVREGMDLGAVAEHAKNTIPAHRVVGVRELLVALKEMRNRPFVDTVKTAFPGAELRRVQSDAELDDEIPF